MIVFFHGGKHVDHIHYIGQHQNQPVVPIQMIARDHVNQNEFGKDQAHPIAKNNFFGHPYLLSNSIANDSQNSNRRDNHSVENRASCRGANAKSKVVYFAQKHQAK